MFGLISAERSFTLTRLTESRLIGFYCFNTHTQVCVAALESRFHSLNNSLTIYIYIHVSVFSDSELFITQTEGAVMFSTCGRIS